MFSVFGFGSLLGALVSHPKVHKHAVRCSDECVTECVRVCALWWTGIPAWASTAQCRLVQTLTSVVLDDLRTCG